MSFNANISKSFADLSVNFATQVANDVIRKLSLKYGFDVREACAYIYGDGVKVATAGTEILRKDLPWCDEIDTECCSAISFGNKLFRQCPKAPKKGLLCTQCANQLEKNGTLRYGDVNARLTCDAMEYEVGKDKVVSYAGYMARNNLTEADVMAAAQSYGLTVDPRQFIATPKRGRPAKKNMSVPEETETEGSGDEAETSPVPAEEDVPDLVQPAPTVPTTVPTPEPAEEEEETSPVPDPTEEEEEEEEMTIDKLRAMERSDLNAFAKLHNVVATTKDKKIALLITKLGLTEDGEVVEIAAEIDVEDEEDAEEKITMEMLDAMSVKGLTALGKQHGLTLGASKDKKIAMLSQHLKIGDYEV
jgi:hypothetical protein